MMVVAKQESIYSGIASQSHNNNVDTNMKKIQVEHPQ